MWKVFHSTLHRLTTQASRVYAAAEVEDARRICLGLQDQGFGTSLCFWNDESDTAEEITRSCLKLLELLRHLDQHSYLIC